MTKQAAQVCSCPDDTQRLRSPRVVWVKPSSSCSCFCSCPPPQPVVPPQPSRSPKHHHQAQSISSTRAQPQWEGNSPQAASVAGCTPKARAALAYREVTAWPEQPRSSIRPFEPGQEVDFTLRRTPKATGSCSSWSSSLALFCSWKHLQHHQQPHTCASQGRSQPLS